MSQPPRLSPVRARSGQREEYKECIKTDHPHPCVCFCLPSSIPEPAILLAIGLVFSEEIVKLREYRAANPNAEPPKFEDPGFRALVEENVKNTVTRISEGPIMTDVSSSSFTAHLNSAMNEIPWHLFLPLDR